MTQHSKFSEAAADLYESNKAIMKLVSDGFLLKRQDRIWRGLFMQRQRQFQACRYFQKQVT